MSSTPQFPSALASGAVKWATANTARDGSGANQQDLVTGGTNGTVIDYLTVEATGATTAGMIRVWHKRSGVYYLVREIAVTAVAAPSATVPSWTSGAVAINRQLASGDAIAVTTHNAEEFAAVATGRSYA